MTKLLLNLFVKNHKNTDDPSVREKIGKLSGITGILVNTLLFVIKLVAGTLSGSVSITADAMNNLSDTASSVVTLVGFKLAGRPADEDHPYGHARYEYLAGLAVAALILVIGFELAKSSLEKIFHPEATFFGTLTIVILVLSVLVKLWLSLFNGKLARLLDSGALRAAALDSRNDIIATGAVLLAGLAERFTGLRIDGFMGLTVAVFIFYSGISMAKDTISPLLGESASPELRQQILAIVNRESRVLGYHDLMVHDYGPGKRFASLHVEMDHAEDPLVCHAIIDKMERKCLRKYNIHLVIHYDPVVMDDPDLNRLRDLVQATLQAEDPRLILHDFRMFQGRKHMNLMFDVTLPHDLTGREDRIREAVDHGLEELQQGPFHCLITFDAEAFNSL